MEIGAYRVIIILNNKLSSHIGIAHEGFRGIVVMVDTEAGIKESSGNSYFPIMRKRIK